MSMPKLFHELRRLRHLSPTASSSLVVSRSIHSQSHHSLISSTNLSDNIYQTSQSRFIPNQSYILFSGFISSRSFSINAPSDNEGFDVEEHIKAETENMADFSFYDASEVEQGTSDESTSWGDFVEDGWCDPAITAIISGLDKYHDFTGLPWWIVIASSTLALRTALLPLLILQLKKMKRFQELIRQLPPPFPPPLSEKSHLEQYLLFLKKKKELGCPSSLWLLASASVQIPSFFLLMWSIRRMSLDHHPGFDCGGILWFRNLTETPDGVLSPIFPLLIAGLHFINIQISLQRPAGGKKMSLLSSFMKYYKNMLNLMTIPIFAIGFYIPQGSLIYWSTSNLLTVIQNLPIREIYASMKSVNGQTVVFALTSCQSRLHRYFLPYLYRQIYMGHPAVQEKLGLSVKSPFTMSANSEALQNLSPDGLLSISLKLLADGHKDRAVSLLRSAVEKDPEYVRGMVVLGQTLMQQEKMVEATEYLERAISKLFVSGRPTTDEEVNLLILASSWAGLTCIQQGNTKKGLEHLKRIPQLKEPEDPKGKGHYYDGFLLLASALVNAGQKDEAVKYLRMAAAYDPAYNEYIEQLEAEDNKVIRAKK